MNKSKILILIFLVSIKFSYAQETLGLIYNDTNETKSSGYTLIKPVSDSRTFLINNCGEVVHQWDLSIPNSRNVYLLENGNLLQSSGLRAEIRDWNNNLVWSIDFQEDLGFTIHHDIEPLPNGNFLVLVRDIYSDNEMFALGQANAYVNAVNVLERIIELQPVANNTANIVWEWKLIDHLIQDVDSSKPNFGIVSDNPQLYNINYDNGNASNPIHANAIDYNPSLDQIAVSARHLSEVFVIDHSTTTAEAAFHTGGIYGKGGDFLWRWGNPEVYNNGTAADKKLGKQHDIKWITEGPNQGKMSVFSNDGYGSNTAASSIHIIDQSDTNGVYSLDSGKFLPENYFWSWDGTIMSEIMHAGAQCGVQIMANGNALIMESDIGRITEVDSEGNVIWVYRIPVGNDTDFDQFSEPLGNGAFRAHRYPEDYLGFNGAVFNNTGIIEDVNSISQDCIDVLSVNESYFTSLNFYPNPTKDFLNFNISVDAIKVYDLSGKMMLSKINSDNINLEDLPNGLYIVNLLDNNNSEYIKISKM